VEIVSGSGSVVTDVNGKRYIDLGSGIGVTAFGIADPVWREAVTAQLAKVQHTSNLYYHEPGAKLAELLCDRTGMKKVFFCNSGAEANECAIKTARRRAFLKYGDESHSTIITLKNSFHGRTITTLAATGQDGFHTDFGPFTSGFVYADPEDTEQLARLVKENGCCAIMMELIQGESGFGKSETALELVQRGHRLVSDDVVEVRRINDHELLAQGVEVIRNLLELRGVGIINVKELYGVQAVRMSKTIDMVIRLEHWSPDKQYDRMGLNTETVKILGNEISCYTVPLMAGRNVSIIIEAAALNHRQKKMGNNAAEELVERVNASVARRKKEKEAEQKEAQILNKEE